MAGQDAWGTQFLRDSTGSGSFSVIGSVTEISGPSREREAIEVTAHDSPDQYREFVKGLKDGGEVSLTINYDPNDAGHEALDDDFEERDNRDYQIIIFPDTADEHTWDFEALITAIGDEFPHDDKMSREVTVKISGKPTLTHTAGS
jgi:predicted secreted protein